MAGEVDVAGLDAWYKEKDAELLKAAGKGMGSQFGDQLMIGRGNYVSSGDVERVLPTERDLYLYEVIGNGVPLQEVAENLDEPGWLSDRAGVECEGPEAEVYYTTVEPEDFPMHELMGMLKAEPSLLTQLASECSGSLHSEAMRDMVRGLWEYHERGAELLNPLPYPKDAAQLGVWLKDVEGRLTNASLAEAQCHIGSYLHMAEGYVPEAEFSHAASGEAGMSLYMAAIEAEGPEMEDLVAHLGDQEWVADRAEEVCAGDDCETYMTDIEEEPEEEEEDEEEEIVAWSYSDVER